MKILINNLLIKRNCELKSNLFPALASCNTLRYQLFAKMYKMKLQSAFGTYALSCRTVALQSQKVAMVYGPPAQIIQDQRATVLQIACFLLLTT